MILYFQGGDILEKFYSVKQVAESLGMSEITIRQWIQHNKIKSVKIGRSRRISEVELTRLQKGE
jgi:excisionase family DNA binding protein